MPPPADGNGVESKKRDKPSTHKGECTRERHIQFSNDRRCCDFRLNGRRPAHHGVCCLQVQQTQRQVTTNPKEAKAKKLLPLFWD